MARRSIEYIKSRFETGDRPDGKDYEDLIDTLIQQATDLGTTSNNELEITGIENVTVVDTFDSNDWRMVKYMISLKSLDGQKYYATEFSVLVDGTNVNVAEYGIMDNDGDMGTISVSRTGDIVGLVVTPNQSITPITVRFARVGLKA
jgi:hypothetical protein